MLHQKIRQIAWSLYGRFAWDKNQNLAITESLCSSIVDTLHRYKQHPQETVLDVGCGTGFFAYQISRHGFQVRGIDYARGMISRAASKFGASSHLQFEIIDVANRLPYPDHSFDHAICVSSVQAFPDPVFSLQEISRVVKAGGIIIITHNTTPATHQLPLKDQLRHQLRDSKQKTWLSRLFLRMKSYAERKGFSTYWSMEELEEILKKSGLIILEREQKNLSIILTCSKGGD